jgi:hypothetical protein
VISECRCKKSWNTRLSCRHDVLSAHPSAAIVLISLVAHNPTIHFSKHETILFLTNPCGKQIHWQLRVAFQYILTKDQNDPHLVRHVTCSH